MSDQEYIKSIFANLDYLTEPLPEHYFIENPNDYDIIVEDLGHEVSSNSRYDITQYFNIEDIMLSRDLKRLIEKGLLKEIKYISIGTAKKELAFLDFITNPEAIEERKRELEEIILKEV